MRNRLVLLWLVLGGIAMSVWCWGAQQTVDSINPIGSRIQVRDIMPTWDVRWYILVDPEGFGPRPIGRTTFPLEFAQDWGRGPLYLTYRDRIGFIATTTIYVPFDSPIGFRVVATARNGLELYINRWEAFDYYAIFDDVNVDEWYILQPGLNLLELRYQHWEGEAYIYFEVGIETDPVLWFAVAFQQQLEILNEQLEALNEQYQILQQRIAVLEERLEE